MTTQVGIKPGPKNYQKYPKTGPNYNIYGDVQGYDYDPYTDRYIRSVEEQSLKDTLLPIATEMLAKEGASELGKQIFGPSKAGEPGLLGQVLNSIKGVFGGTTPAKDVAVQEATQGASAGASGATTNGIMNLGGYGQLGSASAPVAGLGLYGLTDMWKSKRGEEKGALEGVASGAALGASVGGLPGAVIGGLLGGTVGAFRGGPSTRDIEAKRWEKVGRPDLKGMFLEDSFKGKESEIGLDQIKMTPDNYNAIPEWDNIPAEAKESFLKKMLERDKKDDTVIDYKKGGIYYNDAIAKQVAEETKKEFEDRAMRIDAQKEKALSRADKRIKGLLGA